MENRRNDYRHTFPPDDRLSVELRTSRARGTLTGQIVNLSVSGMSVVLDDDTALVHPDERCRATFSIPHGLRRFTLESAVIHTCPTAAGGQFGLHFLPLDDADAQEEQEKAIWVFLLDEQRRLRRQTRGEL
jgi:c-di-GMP-binding flagellar brake protein YcgR